MKFLATKLFILSAIFLCAFNVNAQKERTISAVQGEGDVSPFAKDSVKLEGIVTGRMAKGFFMQTPDDKTDGNPKTSEGIYVFTKSEPPSEATVGNLISVSGTVEEFKYESDVSSLTITELSYRKDQDSMRVISTGNELPKAITLTISDFTPTGNSDIEKLSNGISILEKYEGMRVFVPALTVVAPTYGKFDDRSGVSVSYGTFFGVLDGFPRPFRAPGMDANEFFASKERNNWIKEHPKMTIFDANPEAIRVDSSGQLGAQKIDVTAREKIENLGGIMHYGYGRYTIVTDVDTKAVIRGSIKASALPAPTERQFSVVGMNIENFFDDEDDPSMKEDIVSRDVFETRLKKISLAIRDYLRFPDIIGTVEIENLAALKRLAERINKDAIAAKQPNPKYEAYLMDGNDGRGIDVGFLVKTARVTVKNIEQIGKDEMYKDPNKKKDAILNDRPSLILRAEIEDPKNKKPFLLTVIVSHLKSFNGYDDKKDGGLRVRTKKKIQAEFLAKAVQDIQKKNPDEHIILVGDFNFYQFNDGIMDVMGTLKGTPASKDEVLMPSDDLVNPDLINLVDFIKQEEQYSYTFDGNAQVLDHILVTQNLGPTKHLIGFGYAHLNADFPEIYRNDPNRVEKFSDHDVAVAYFSLDEKQTADKSEKVKK